MPQVSASIEITQGDDIRVRARPGGGFHVLIGTPGDHRVVLSFALVETAEALATVLTTSAIAHGRLGDALAATEPGSNVAPFPRRPPTNEADAPPLDVA